jgi:hypothetical protein
MTQKIVVVGSANTDFVLTIAELPCKGMTVLGDKFRVVRGGKGANQSVAAARAFLRTIKQITYRPSQSFLLTQQYLAILSMALWRSRYQKLFAMQTRSLPNKQELEQFMVSSAPGSNPAVQAAVDLSNQAETSL